MLAGFADGLRVYVCDRKGRSLARAACRMHFAIYEMRDVGTKAGLQWEGQEFIFGHVSLEMPVISCTWRRWRSESEVQGRSSGWR